MLLRRALLATEQPSVLVVKDGVIELRKVLLRDNVGDDLIEVSSGLLGGETVVINPDPALKAGDRVQIKRAP